MDATPVVTRIAPSPTGYMHIGTARTALFNWLYARGRGGRFLLRIEDTDRARSTPEATQAILEGMRWLGLDWDGEVVSQWDRRDRHAEVAHQMLARGSAYKCFSTQDEIEAFREAARAEGRSTLFRSPWRDADPATHPDAPFVIRVKAPLDGETVIDDRVQGEVTIRNAELDDMICLRSDGSPTYMLAVVVDDHDMGVTHVIRGDDHLNNAARQMLVYARDGLAGAGLGAYPADPRARTARSCRNATARWGSRTGGRWAIRRRRCATTWRGWAGATATTSSSPTRRRWPGSTSTASAGRRRGWT